MSLKRRQREILEMLKILGGEATTRQIAERLNLNVNGVSQTLGALHEHEYIQYLSGRGGETKWKLRQ